MSEHWDRDDIGPVVVGVFASILFILIMFVLVLIAFIPMILAIGWVFGYISFELTVVLLLLMAVYVGGIAWGSS